MQELTIITVTKVTTDAPLRRAQEAHADLIVRRLAKELKGYEVRDVNVSVGEAADEPREPQEVDVSNWGE